MNSLIELKSRYTIADAWADEGFDGQPAKCTHSPFRTDRKKSFSVFADGRQFKDHATGESGDVFAFIQLARNCDFANAVRIAKERMRTPGLRRAKPFRKHPRQAISPAKPKACAEISNPLALHWQNGIRKFRESPDTCSSTDRWRGWPSGTTASLCEGELIAYPTINGHAGIAFPVHFPAQSGLIQVGFHFRANKTGKWQFLPNVRTHGHGIRPCPFIIGHAHLTNAHTIIITEGQWDAISWAAWAGWLAHDNAWPDGIVLLGILGANNWRIALELYEWPQTANVLLIPDNDEAGNSWKTGFLSKLKERSARVIVAQPEANDLGDQLKAANEPATTIHNILSEILT